MAANPGTPWLVAGGWLSLAASALHVACIVGGEKWYRFVGAGEDIAMAAASGALWPHLLTLGIAVVLALWAAYAFSGAGRTRRPPLLRTALVLIAAVYLLRALVVLPALAIRPEALTPFAIVSSLIVLVYGVAYAVGTARAWMAMRQTT
ncbi:hypothetical protein [Aurantiacibacter arachoides]|uniref:hypothetical protein n=1 Tax=Aurantiacibacter arachoides TaxID=1850444 RepID=UPI001F31E017|nr:hypothetical protein [Aurantiacibacter arachoides]